LATGLIGSAACHPRMLGTKKPGLNLGKQTPFQRPALYLPNVFTVFRLPWTPGTVLFSTSFPGQQRMHSPQRFRVFNMGGGRQAKALSPRSHTGLVKPEPDCFQKPQAIGDPPRANFRGPHRGPGGHGPSKQTSLEGLFRPWPVKRDKFLPGASRIYETLVKPTPSRLCVWGLGGGKGRFQCFTHLH